MIPGQKPTLLLQLAHQIGQLLHYALIRAEVLLRRQHHAEVEDELIAVVPVRLDADRVAQDAMTIRANLDQVPTQLLSRDHEEGNVGESEEEGLRGRRGGRDEGAVGDLVDDFGAWSRQYGV